MDTRETNYANIIKLWQRCERQEEPDIIYFAIGHEEITSNNRRHRHLYIETTTKLSGRNSSNTSWAKGKELIGCEDAHFESAKGSRQQGVDYVFKENPNERTFVYEKPEDEDYNSPLPKRLRIVNELKTFKTIKDAATYGSKDLQNYIATYPNAAEKNLSFRNDTPLAQKMVLHDTIFNWQLHICEYLQAEPKERQIFWVESTTWGDGKSYCANLIQAFRQGQKLPFENLNIHHLAGIITPTSKVLIFDLPRSFDVGATDFTNTIEELSNHTMVTSSKYAGKSIFIKKHLVIFSNSKFPFTMAHKDIVHYELNKPASTFTVKKIENGRPNEPMDFVWENIPFIKENF